MEDFKDLTSYDASALPEDRRVGTDLNAGLRDRVRNPKITQTTTPFTE